MKGSSCGQTPVHPPGTQIWGSSHGIRMSEHRLISLPYVPTQTPFIFCVLGLTSMSIYSKQAQAEKENRVDRNQYVWCETFRVLTVFSGVTCSDRSAAGMETRCHLTSSSLEGQHNLQQGWETSWRISCWKGPESLCLQKRLSKQLLSTPARLHGNTLFHLHKQWSRQALQDWSMGICY